MQSRATVSTDSLRGIQNMCAPACQLRSPSCGRHTILEMRQATLLYVMSIPSVVSLRAGCSLVVDTILLLHHWRDLIVLSLLVMMVTHRQWLLLKHLVLSKEQLLVIVQLILLMLDFLHFLPRSLFLGGVFEEECSFTLTCYKYVSMKFVLLLKLTQFFNAWANSGRMPTSRF